MAENKLKLRSSDSEVFDVNMDTVKLSGTLGTMLEDLCGNKPELMGDEEIPLQNVSGAILKKVLQWCEYHKSDPAALKPVDDPSKQTDISEWDMDFLKVDNGTLFEIILAANYLDIKVLLNIACKTAANMLKGKSAEQVREEFNIESDFGPGEEEKIRKENEWCEDRERK